MTINESKLEWAYPLKPLDGSVEYIVLHHAAGSGSVKAVHDYHRYSNGWSGIAYHLYVRRDGSVWRGRPMDKRGAHCSGCNGVSIGICFEGDFTKETMSETQKNAGIEAVKYALEIYPKAKIVGHSELYGTLCPGDNFPLDEMKRIVKTQEEKKMTGEEIYKALEEYFLSLKFPDWAKAEFERAIELGITDGTSPMLPTPKYQAAIMAKRALEAANK